MENVTNNSYVPYNVSNVSNFITLKPKSIEYKKKDMIFSIIFIVISFVIVDFILLNGLNLGFTIAFALLFAVSTAYLYNRENKVSPFTVICGALSLLSTVGFTLYHDYMMNVIMLFVTLSLFSVYTIGISGTFRYREGSFKIIFDILDAVFVKPFANLGLVFRSFTSSFNAKSSLKNVVIGIAVSLPVLFVIIPLLVSGDAAFSGLVKMVFKNVGVYLGEAALVVLIAPYLISHFVTKSKKIDFKQVKAGSSKRPVPSAVTVSFLSAISVTYVAYMFSQLAYFFSAFAGILPEDYTGSASEYARRGFFEMFAICVINFIIITLASALTKRNGRGRTPIAVKLLSLFIVAFSLVLLITAMQKMKMNIEFFGLSKNRVLVSVFMLMMLAVILFYVIHMFKPSFGYMQGVVIVCSAVLVALSFTNLDGQIAKYNVEKYISGELDSIDVSYLYSLSDSAHPYISELNKAEDHNVAKNAKYYTVELMLSEYEKYIDFNEDNIYEAVKLNKINDFREYNAARSKSAAALAEYYNSLSKAEKEALYSQYKLDSDDEYIYSEQDDTYYKWNDQNYNKYIYNEKSDKYEYNGVADETYVDELLWQ